MNTNISKKYDENESIIPGDLLMYEFNSHNVTKAIRHKKDITDSNRVIGVCTNVNGMDIIYTNSGIADVNVTGLVCLGDKLVLSELPGKAVALKYKEDSTIFGKRSIGKIIELYNDYNKVKVLLDIE